MSSELVFGGIREQDRPFDGRRCVEPADGAGDRESQSEEDRLFAEFARSGDPARLGRVYDRVAPELLGVALHLLRDSAEAEDALQATFLAAIERARDYDPSRRVRPWLLGILANHARRIRAGARPVEVRERDLRAQSPAEEAELAELREQLAARLGSVPEPYQPVVILRVQHGLSTAEIAHALRRPPGTVRSQLARGLEHLRRTLPSGLAGAVTLLLARPTRGLGAVREAVLAQAVAKASAAGITTIAGGIAMKKVALACAVVLVAALGWKLWPSAVEPPERETSRLETAELGADAPADPASEETAAPLPIQGERAPLAAIEEPASGEAIGPPEATTGALAIRALWEDGEPAAGEIVLVTAGDRLGFDADRTVARTGEDGAARVEGLEPGPFHVQLLRGVPDAASVRVSAGDTEQVSLRIRSGMTVEGRVVDASGAAVPFARVWLSERWRADIGHWIAKAGPDGRYSVRAVSRDHFLGAAASGYAPSCVQQVKGNPGETVELDLVLGDRGGGLRGTVTDGAGRPVAGATVLAGGGDGMPTARLASGLWTPSSPTQREAIAADGAFAFDGLPLGLQRVEVWARGFAPSRGEVEIAPGSGPPLAIALSQGCVVRGRILDERGDPVRSATASATDGARFLARAVSDADGRFTLSRLPRGEVALTAGVAGRGEAQIELVLAEGETREWNPTLAPKLAIAGRASDEHGEPLAGWSAVAIVLEDRSVRTVPSSTDSAGRFEIAVPEDRAYSVWITEPTDPVRSPMGWRAFPRWIAKGIRPTDAPLEIEIGDKERTCATIEGTVAVGDGTDATGVELTIWHREHAIWREFVVDGATGRFRIEGIPPGTGDLDLRSDRLPWKHLGAHPLVAGRVLDLGTIELPAGGTLAVELVGGDERALATLVSWVTGSDNREAGMLSGSGRERRSNALAPGRYTIGLNAEGVRMVQRELDVAAGRETRVAIELEPACVRSVLLSIPAETELPPGAWCRALDAAGRVAWFGNTDQAVDGKLVLRVSAAPGIYDLFAEAQGGLRGAGAITLGTADDARPIEIALQR